MSQSVSPLGFQIPDVNSAPGKRQTGRADMSRMRDMLRVTSLSKGERPAEGSYIIRIISRYDGHHRATAKGSSSYIGHQPDLVHKIIK